MFNKKNCKRCGKKIKENYGFCPTCGINLRKSSNKSEWGMLGKDDYVEQEEDRFPSQGAFGGISSGFLNKMMGSAMKMLEKELAKEIKGVEKQEIPRTKIRLMINGKEITPNQIKQTPDSKKKVPTKKLPINFSKENLKKFQKLDKKEPKTEVRRLGDRIIYELNVPGVGSIADISIIKLESGIEIKAVAKNKAYFKIIPINLTLIKYVLSKGKLTLEMDAKD